MQIKLITVNMLAGQVVGWDEIFECPTDTLLRDALAKTVVCRSARVAPLIVARVFCSSFYAR